MGETTPNLGLYKPTVGETGWGDEVNANFDTLDSRLTPPLDVAVQFVHPSGDNAADGLTWATAKEDIMSAYDALGSQGGTIFIVGGAGAQCPIGADGIWIMGPGDTDYNNGTLTAPRIAAGWRAQKRVSFIGIGYNAHTANGQANKVNLSPGTGDPTIWISGTNVPISFENLHTAYPNRFARIGIQSDGVTRHANTSNVTFRNVGFQLNNVVNAGPGVDQGGDTFWIRWYDCVFSGPNFNVTPSSVTETGGTATITTSTGHNVSLGDWVYLWGFTPAAYNGHFQVQTVPTTETFTITLGSSPGNPSVVGQFKTTSSNMAACSYRVGEKTDGSGLGGEFMMDNCVSNFGAIRFYGTTGVWNFLIRYLVCEGDWQAAPPLMELFNGGGNGAGIIEHSGIADGDPAVGAVHVVTGKEIGGEIDAVARVVVTGLYGEVKGPAIIINGGRQTLLEHPADNGQIVIDRGMIHADTWGHRRTAGVVPAFAANLATHDTSTWNAKTTNGAAITVTTGKADPFGGTQGVRFEASGSSEKLIYSASRTIGVGDWLIGGVWARAVEASAVSTPLYIEASSCILDEGGAYIGDSVMYPGGAWEWLWAAGEVTTATTPATVSLKLRVDASKTMEYAFPVLFHVAAADAGTDSEMREKARHFAAWPNTVPVGAVSTLRDQKLIAWGGIGVGNSVAGTTVGSPAKTIEVFDQTGAILGYVPIYDAALDDDFTPTDITGLVAWYDFSDITTLFKDTARTTAVTTDADVIKGVTNKAVAGGPHLAEATNGPAYKVNIQNSRSVARFDGTDDELTATGFTGTAARTVVVVAIKRGALSGAADTLLSLEADGKAQLFTDTDDHPTGFNYYANSTSAVTTNVATGPTAWGIWVLRYNTAASLDIYSLGGTPVNLNPDDQYKDDATQSRGLGHNQAGAGSNFGDYDIGEYLEWNVALTAGQLNTIGTYLADRWNLTWNADLT